MIIGIGSDITSIKRIARVYKKYGERFAKRILTPDELESYARRFHKVPYLAKRFAVKEAAAKALGTGIKRGVSWRHIAALNKPSGAPYLVLEGAAQERFNQLGAKSSFVTITDETDYAVAFVVITDD